MPKLVLIAALMLLSSPAAAQDTDDPVIDVDADTSQDADMSAPAAFDLSGEVDLLSDYRFRGVSRSDEDPAVQAALNLSHASGLYVGARGTTLQGLDSFRLRDPAFQDLGDVEIDLYAGYGAQLGGGFSADAGLLYYLFLGGEGPNDYVEPYASLSYLIGPAEFTAGAKYAPSQDAIGNEDMLYLFGQADVSIPFRPWRFSALVGHQDWGTYGSYWTWSLGVEHRLSLGRGADAEIGLRYVDTSLGATPGADAGLVASLGFSF